MSSRAMSGRPGGGKSYYSVKLLLRELFETERPIVTNLPLRLDNILKYCLAHDRDDIDVYSRIMVLEDDLVSTFWRYRGNGIEPLPDCTNEQYKKGDRPAFDRVQPGGVCYFLDEVHDFLNSRNWMKTGDGCLYYISKHRHLGDDVFWITQAVKNVDSQFRSVTQDYTYCRNFSKEKYRGFTKGKYFTATTYLEPLTWAQLHLNGDFQEQEKFTLEPDIACCYYTSKQRLSADTGKAAKGINIKWVFAGIGALVLLAALAAWFVPKAVEKKILEKGKKDYQQARGKMGPVNPDAPGHVGNRINPGSAPLTTPAIAPDREVINIAVLLQNISAGEALLSMQGQNDASVTFRASPFGNSIMVSGVSLQNVIAGAEAVKMMDADKPVMVMIQAVVLRTASGKSSNVGVWHSLQDVIASDGFGLGSLTFDPVAGILTMGSVTAAQEVIRIMGSQNVGRSSFHVESRPIMAACSGQEAWFSSGQELPVPVTTSTVGNSQTSIQYKTVQFSLGVLPSVMPDGSISLTIKQSNADVIGSATIAGNTVPTVASQSLFTRLNLREGEVAVIGGIQVTNKTDKTNGVPILGVLPPLSWIFGNRDKDNQQSELVIMLTAHRVQAGSNPLPVRKAEPVKKISDKKETARIGNPQKTQVKKER